MANPLDPLTTEPIAPSTVNLDNRAAFLSLQSQVLQPLAKVNQNDTKPRAAETDKVEGTWYDFDPQITSRWTVTVDGSGGVTFRDGISLTPGWSLGDSVVVARSLKIGQLVRVKIVVTHGTNKLYGNANVASVSGGPQTIGDYGETSFVLPYPPHSSAHSGFATGIQTGTVTLIDASNVTERQPLYRFGNYLTLGSAFSASPSFLNRSGYNGRVPLTFLDPPTWNPGPAVYFAGFEDFMYALPGETFTYFLKYHTDV